MVEPPLDQLQADAWDAHNLNLLSFMHPQNGLFGWSPRGEHQAAFLDQQISILVENRSHDSRSTIQREGFAEQLGYEFGVVEGRLFGRDEYRPVVLGYR